MESPTILCTPCLRESQIVDAIKYCVDCNENMCRRCLRLHIKANATECHKLISADDKTEVVLAQAHDTHEVRCPRHAENALSMFCEDHQLLCCGECIDIEHNSCERVIDIITACYEKDEADYIKMSTDAETVLRDLETVRTDRQTDKAKSRRNTADALASIREFRKMINTLLDSIEKNTVDVINTNCIAEDERANDDINDVNNMVKSLETTVNQLNTPDMSDKQMFMHLINGQKLVESAKKLQETVSVNSGKEINVFIRNDKITQFLSHVHEIGRVSTNQCTKLRLKCGVDLDDNDACDIQGSLQHSDGRAILTDHANKNIKILTPSNTMGGKLDLTSAASGIRLLDGPFSVCSVSDTQMAVSMDRDKVVQLVDVANMSVTDDVIEVDEIARGLAYSFLYDELYVCCGGGSYVGEGLGHIRVYNLKGMLLNKFKTTEIGKQLTPRPMHIAMSQDGTKIHIADADRGVITIDRRGKLLACFTAPELVEARGVCVDVTGHVIVCGYQSHNVIQLGDDGKKYFVLLTEADGIRYPTSVCYNSNRAGLAVTMSDRVMIFDTV